MKYFLYRHIRLDKNKPFYIGIGRKRERAYSSYTTEYERAFCKQRNQIWNRITKKSDYEVEILFETDSEQLILEKEKEFIALYGRMDMVNGCLANLTDGGEGLSNPSIETRKLISRGLTGIKRSQSTKEKIRKAVKGTKKGPCPKSVKEAISAKNTAKGNGMYGNKGILNILSKPIEQYTFDGVLIRTWANAREVDNSLNINYKYISACCTGIQKSAKGYIWKFKTTTINDE
jgi:hypothetical protein